MLGLLKVRYVKYDFM